MKLTDEQKVIVDSSGNIKVHAVAGSGKTSTLVYFSEKRKNKRILYLAFNRSVKAEAMRRFAEKALPNVKIETAHSLAYRHIVFREKYEVRYTYKSSEIAQILKLASSVKNSLSNLILAYHIGRFSVYFCNSSVQKVQELDYLSTITDPQAKSFAQKHIDQIIQGTRTLLAKMNSGEIPVFHDFYLKKFQLTKPDLDFDYILFDEGQDASPVMLDIFLNQKNTSKVIVGDIHQQIYSWRYAINALANVDFEDYSLTTSFRFPQYIADLAMNCLKWKESFSDYIPVKITGAGKLGKVHSKVTLARTNMALLKSAIDFTSKNSGSKRIYFEGNFSTYTASENGSLYDVLNLFNDNKEYIKNPEIAGMKNFEALCEFADMSGDTELTMLIALVEEYGKELPWHLKKIKEMHLEDEKRDTASMVFSTVHKCKGLEYDSVTLESDFIDEDKIKKLSEKKDLPDSEIDKINEEINLRYVAITRSKNKIIFMEDEIKKNKAQQNSKQFPTKESYYNSSESHSNSPKKKNRSDSKSSNKKYNNGSYRTKCKSPAKKSKY